jgi:enamine deaminase RidA (YjgF/YER057c/UK114 family)
MIQRLAEEQRLSGAVVHGGLVWLAGQVADDPSADAEGQTADVLRQIDDLLRQAGTDKGRLLSVTVVLADILDAPAMNRAWDRWVDPAAKPARMTIRTGGATGLKGGPPAGRRRGVPPRGFLTAEATALVLMLLVAGGVADEGWLFSAAAFIGVGAAVGALYLLFPHGPQFALNAANGLAMYTCLFAVVGRSAFPEAEDWARPVAFLLPIASFVGACWALRAAMRPWIAAAHAPDLAHLPRFAGWLAAMGAVAVLCLALPINRTAPGTQTLAMLGAMALVSAISAATVSEVVRLLADIAAIFREVTGRLARLAVPVAAYCSLWALLTVVFGCLYRIADGFSLKPLFQGADGAIRVGFPEALHFSAVTLSTVGYGDIQPMDDGIRLLATVQALSGQLLLLFGFYEIMRGSQAGMPESELPDDEEEPEALAEQAGESVTPPESAPKP